MLGLSGTHGTSGPDRLAEYAALFVRDHGVRLRSAAVDANNDERHI
jgi:hypothetical protein